MIFAALFAPVVDRVYLGLRDASRERLRELYRQRDVTPGVEIDFYFGLLARPLPYEALRDIANYGDRDPLGDGVSQGILTVDDTGACALTPRGRDLALEVQTAVGAGAAELWGDQDARLPRLNAHIARLLKAGRHSGGPVFHAVSEVYEPDGASQEVVLSTRLGALRHHRADAHRAAWRSAGLSSVDLANLRDSAARRHIEEDTDRRNTPLFSPLSDDERYELLAGLGALPN